MASYAAQKPVIQAKWNATGRTPGSRGRETLYDAIKVYDNELTGTLVKSLHKLTLTFIETTVTGKTAAK